MPDILNSREISVGALVAIHVGTTLYVPSGKDIEKRGLAAGTVTSTRVNLLASGVIVPVEECAIQQDQLALDCLSAAAERHDR